MTDLLGKILAHNGIDGHVEVSQFSAGQTNEVYGVGGAYVVKIEKRILHVTSHQPELVALARAAGARVPEILGAGTIDGSRYLLMRQAEGRRVAEDWWGFSEAQKASLMGQLAQQLQILHSIQFAKYTTPDHHEYDSWKEAIQMFTRLASIHTVDLDAHTQENFVFIQDYFLAHENLLDDGSGPVLVHNDVHFENILHQNGTLTALLDFDFACQAPMDYELCYIVDFFQCPRYYLDEPHQAQWDAFVLTNELRWLHDHHPELFAPEPINSLFI